TATIITDNVSADNYKPLVRPTAIVILATVVEDDNAPQIFCKRNSKYAEIGRNTCGAIGGEVFEELSCVIDATCTQITANFSLNACASLDGEPVPTCNGTPIPYTPNPIPKTQKIHAYTIGNTIILQNVPKDAKVQLYNLNGKLIYSANSGNSQILKILVQTKGMYIVKAGKQTLRIAVTHRSLP
ncbi:MAG: T9SS type A sorting domain-containing protein, partial [Fibromonadales bacterium]|nr:T9SS type A sorting domain-containing protein [Fibromonadales bacterium]